MANPGFPHPVDAASDCRRAASALEAVAELCVDSEPARIMTAEGLGPVLELLAQALKTRLDILDGALYERFPDPGRAPAG
jgi:hypothetical protein